MKSSTLPLLLILFFSSCITSTHVHYSDPNYLNSDEFNTYEEIYTNNYGEQESLSNDTTINSNTDYLTNDYYDYSFSSRIRRFHKPIYYSRYYSGIYTDYYWYNNDPFFCGTSIYYGYNWHSPYYSYYSYSPYYFNYYSPYYYGNYYSYNGYHHHAQYNTHHTHNAYINGNRGSLSSNSGIRGVNNISSNTKNHTSTLNIRSNHAVKKNTINNRNYNSKSSIKTINRDSHNSNTIQKRSDRKNSSYSNYKTNSNKKNNSYSNSKTNNRSYKSNNRNRSNSGGKSSKSNRRSMKPRQ